MTYKNSGRVLGVASCFMMILSAANFALGHNSNSQGVWQLGMAVICSFLGVGCFIIDRLENLEKKVEGLRADKVALQKETDPQGNEIVSE